eukprot:1120441_1
MDLTGNRQKPLKTLHVLDDNLANIMHSKQDQLIEMNDKKDDVGALFVGTTEKQHHIGKKMHCILSQIHARQIEQVHGKEHYMKEHLQRKHNCKANHHWKSMNDIKYG